MLQVSADVVKATVYLVQMMFLPLTLALLETTSAMLLLVFLTATTVENARKPCCSR